MAHITGDWCIGAKIESVKGCDAGSQEVTIHTDKGTLIISHEQYFSEKSEVVSIGGDATALVGKTIRDFFFILPDEDSETQCSFYQIRTEDVVTIEWLGEVTDQSSVAVDVNWISSSGNHHIKVGY